MHAMLGAVARDVKGGDQDVARAWHKFALNTTAELRIYKDPDVRLRKAMQLREDMSHNEEVMARSQMQRIYEIVGIRNMLRETWGKASVPDILAFYEELRMKEPITESFINTALHVHSRVVASRAAEWLLLRLDGLPKARNPFSSIQCLQCVVSKAQTDKNLLLWFLDGIVHMIARLGVSPDSPDLSPTGILGNLPGECGHVGTLDLLAFKKAANQHLFGTLAGDMGLDTAGGDWLLKAKRYYDSHWAYYLWKCPEMDRWQKA